MVFKTYSTFSARRFSSDLREAHERGYLFRMVPGMKTTAFMEDETFTPILKQLIHASSLPLRAVETDFAIDSSGFGSCRFERWIDEKYGVPRKKAIWVKCHIACGVKTNIVTAVRILDKDAADSPQFTPLVKETADGFVIGEVRALHRNSDLQRNSTGLQRNWGCYLTSMGHVLIASAASVFWRSLMSLILHAAFFPTLFVSV